MKFPKSHSLQEIANLLNCKFIGDKDFQVLGMNEIHVVEPGDPSGTINYIVGPVHGDQSLAHIVERRFYRSHVVLGQREAYRPVIREPDLAVANLVLLPADDMDANGVVAHAQFGLVAHFGFGN